MRYFFILSFLIIPISLHAQVDSLRQELQHAQNNNDSVSLLIDISRAIHKAKHDESEELSLARKALSLADKEDTLLYSRALDNIGLLHRYHQNYTQAFDLHAKAFKLSQAASLEPIYQMIFANNAGVAARYDQAFDQAISHYLEALKIAERESDLKNIAISCNGLGNTYSYIKGKEDLALSYFQRSLEAELERDNSLGVAMNYLSISDHYTNLEDFPKSREYLEKLLKLNEERKYTFGLAITYEYLGHNYFSEGKDLNKANRYFQRSIELFDKLGNKHKTAGLLNSKASLLQKLGDTGEAARLYEKSLDISTSMSLKALAHSNALGLSQIMEENQDYGQALHYFKLAEAYKDSINLHEQETQIAALTRQYDLEKKENQIELLEKDKDLQQAELAAQGEKLKKHQAFLFTLSIFLLALILVSTLIYRNAKHRKQAEKLIQEQEKMRFKAEYERNLLQAEILVTRLQMNPHFLFNCLNAIKYLIQLEDYKTAKEYLVVFSRFVRKVLETSQNPLISLSEELKLVSQYLQLEKIRFDDHFTYCLNHGSLDKDELNSISIPPLLLQPFVENAIWHGLLKSEKPEKRISIEITHTAEGYEICITDNGVGRRKNSSNEHTSLGTKITQDRIDLFNQSNQWQIDFTIHDLAEGTKVCILLKSKTLNTKNQLHEYSSIG
ncbi:tetratricopeptide repeat protein [Litoribacter ruber]|uniref:tetratricopeptide repeat-containing sensor histidine kinase n=1 Tax=Litoribacter ruber TaxID=702568 RepID=UPI001BD95196|nr:tetratricopeptide repeat protein [Litoribacter ruber]MBT0810494.1 tetratricopeptide repeat protein [Litoribacter ruber]